MSSYPICPNAKKTWACRYEEDLALARDVGSNAFRFSLEWSKVEPQRGSIDKSAIQRYQQIIRCIRRSSSCLHPGCRACCLPDPMPAEKAWFNVTKSAAQEWHGASGNAAPLCPPAVVRGAGRIREAGEHQPFPELGSSRL